MKAEFALAMLLFVGVPRLRAQEAGLPSLTQGQRRPAISTDSGLRVMSTTTASWEESA